MLIRRGRQQGGGGGAAMSRKPEKQKRIGFQEKRQISALVKKIRRYRIFAAMRNQRETRFNDRLMDYLRQPPNPLDVSNRKIPAAEFVGEQFRPEFYLGRNPQRRLCAVECKRLADKSAKSRWKEGLSQAILYSSVYKYVVLVFLDFTAGSKYARKFGPGNKPETRFARRLEDSSRIRILMLKCVSE
jgi:hypothetical protein